MRQLFARAVVLAAVIGAGYAAVTFAENVDPGNTPVGQQFAWGENVGWINAEPALSGTPIAQGVTVSGTGVTGYMYGENIGWINLNCSNNATCGSTGNYGIKNDGLGNLGGYAWGENVGWINFSCNNNPSTCATTGSYGVHINPATGEWTGDAWGENIGWINFDHNQNANRITTDDFDGVPGASDNCPFDAPSNQTNTDFDNPNFGFAGNDGFGDLCDDDDDGDGCDDVEEMVNSGNSEIFGGKRDFLDKWDFFDVTGDAAIDLADALAVLDKFGLFPAPNHPDNRLDRQLPLGGQPYAPEEATGNNVGIDLQDALLNLQSFGHNCAGPP
jgi:hypothetical protein